MLLNYHAFPVYNLKMNFPGMPGGGGGAVSSTAGMSDQETDMIKAVSLMLRNNSSIREADKFATADARSYGKLPFQNRLIWWYGLRLGRSFRTIHVECK